MRISGLSRNLARNVLFACSILLFLLLTACGTIGAPSSSTPTPSSTAAVTPTTAATSTAANLTTYTGNGYTIGYPQGWKANASGNSVVFSDPNSIYTLTLVVAPNPGGALGPDTVVNTSVQGVTATLKNTQTVNVPSSTTIGGDSWTQKSVSGTSSATGQVGVVQLVVASDNHPANSASTSSYTVIYGTLQATFDAANGQYFQPMLQSFKFTS